MTFQVLADFDRDNSFAYDLTPYTQSVRFFNGMREMYQSVGDDTTIELSLVNTDGRFNPEDSGGAYYGTITLNSPVQVLFDGGTLAMGRISSLDPEHITSGSYTGKTYALITCDGLREKLSRATVDLSIYQNTLGGTIIEDIVEAAGESVIAETGQTTFAHFGDESPNSNAWTAINMITEGERGRFFQNRTGSFTWWDRHHIPLLTTCAGTVDMSGAYRPVDADYEYRLSNIANVIRVEVQPRNTMDAAGTLWYQANDITVPAGGTITFEGLMRDGDGKYVGADSVTLQPVFSAGTATLSYEIYGARVAITAENSGVLNAIIDEIAVIGTGYQNRNPLIYQAEDAASITANGRRQIEITLPPLASFNDAITIGSYELRRRKNAMGVVRSIVFKEPGNGTDNAHLIQWNIGTRLKVQLNNGHDSEHLVIGEEHSIELPGQTPVHECRLFLEPVSPQQYWILGRAGYSELGSTTYLAY